MIWPIVWTKSFVVFKIDVWKNEEVWGFTKYTKPVMPLTCLL